MKNYVNRSFNIQSGYLSLYPTEGGGGSLQIAKVSGTRGFTDLFSLDVLMDASYSMADRYLRNGDNHVYQIKEKILEYIKIFMAFSPAFFMLYIAAGASDMIDGAVARKTDTVSEFGSKLDTIADIVFAAVCLIKVLPVLDVPVWLYIWIAIIAFIKAANIAEGYIRQKEFISVHSMINKVTGGLLFVFPLTLAFIDLRYSAAVVCMVATAAAIQEGHVIRTGSGNNAFRASIGR